MKCHQTHDYINYKGSDSWRNTKATKSNLYELFPCPLNNEVQPSVIFVYMIKGFIEELHVLFQRNNENKWIPWVSTSKILGCLSLLNILLWHIIYITTATESCVLINYVSMSPCHLTTLILISVAWSSDNKYFTT